MGLIKDKYRQFRQWQQQPFDYHDTDDHHHCSNCGNDYENNYCPRCGQKAVYGPITWRSVWRGILDVWGVGTRSLPQSIWQLLWRPGYLIRDYISGKRQASFPPVKMLVIVALVLVVVNNLLGLVYSDGTIVMNGNAYAQLLERCTNWLSDHIAWTALIAFSLFVVPTWFLFRHAPRLPQHTLPQGFYIQVFMGVQYLTYVLLVILIFHLILSSSKDGDETTGFMIFLVLPVMFLFDYKQLFGYGWWGSLWRILVAIPLSLLVGKMILSVFGVVYHLYVKDFHSMTLYVVNTINYLVLMWGLFEIINVINIKPWRDGSDKKTLLRPLLAIAALLLVTFVSGLLGFETSFHNLYRSFGTLFM